VSSLLQKMTVIDFPAGDEGEELPGAPGKGRPAVRDSAPARHLAAAGAGIAKFGGGYALATGIGAAVCVAAKIPVDLDLAVAGACLMHGGQRITEGWFWHRQGGAAARRRRRRYQGEADPLHVRERLSPAFAAKKMKRLAPDLPAAQAHIGIGTTVHRPRQQVAVSRAETIAVFGVPQSIKTALISSWIADAPGAVLATSSRADQYRHTALAREARGEVHVLDADGYGPGTTFAWSPVPGCEDSEVALRRAGAFMYASPRDTSGKDKWHEARGTQLLCWALHAAALTGGGMYQVRQWVRDPEDELFAKALRREDAAPEWAAELEGLLAEGPELTAAASASAKAALGWMDSRVLAAAASPEPGQGLDIAAFLRKGSGTVYLIGSDRPYGSLTPYFSVFAGEFLEEARVLAEESGGRLPVPLTVAADEAATTARLDFARWCAVTAGYNITVIAGFQAVSQISEAWGGDAATETILTMFSTKVIAGGATSVPELDRLSFVCGERDTWAKEGGVRTWSRERVFPPERIRMLPDFNALVVHRNCKPVQVVIRPVWARGDYAPLTIVPERPASEAPETTEE
jgi:type IV secretion system protein VirD4